MYCPKLIRGPEFQLSKVAQVSSTENWLFSVPAPLNVYSGCIAMAMECFMEFRTEDPFVTSQKELNLNSP